MYEKMYRQIIFYKNITDRISFRTEATNIIVYAVLTNIEEVLTLYTTEHSYLECQLGKTTISFAGVLLGLGMAALFSIKFSLKLLHLR